MTQTAELTPTTAKTKCGLVPYLSIDGAAKAADFYVRAFGAEIAAMQPVDDKGRTMHVHIYLNGGSLMLSDFYPEHGHPAEAHSGFTVALTVDDIDAWWKRAVDAGATVVQPVSEMFWGDRYGALKDPFGISWAMNEPKTA